MGAASSTSLFPLVTSPDQSSFSQPKLLSTSPPLYATPLVPPNWEKYLRKTKVSGLPYQLFPVPTNSLEFQTIKELLSSVTVISAEKVVNPTLWQRFSDRYQQMLKEKTEDLDVLLKLGLDQEELVYRLNHAMDFVRDPQLETGSGKYSPNQVFLFHGTRSLQNLDNILVQGLDDRFSYGGVFGRGIYLADEPQTSMNYDGTGGHLFIFSVLLGDCLSIPFDQQGQALLREPEKGYEQKRNANDQFFDSVVGGGIRMETEYVINNRSQCYPMYLVTYKRSIYRRMFMFNPTGDPPPVAWRKAKDSKFAMPNPDIDGNWQCYATSVYRKMEVLPGPKTQNGDCHVKALEGPSASEEKSKDSELSMANSSPSTLKANLSVVAFSLSHFQTFHVHAASPEFAAIAELVSPIRVLLLEQIANPELWQSFLGRWKEMVRSKANPSKGKLRTFNKYSPNLSLLFYTPKDDEELREILMHGMDPRTITSTYQWNFYQSQAFNGTFGRALHFMDDPTWSIWKTGSPVGGHILVFAVLLGDCLPIDDLRNKSTFVREPMKTEAEEWSPGDYCFDSVTARTTGKFMDQNGFPLQRGEYNEYGIYSTGQCYPLYQVKYWDSYGDFADIDNASSTYTAARRETPFIAWRKHLKRNWLGQVTSVYKPPPNNENWPFLASNIFKRMSSQPDADGSDGSAEPGDKRRLVDDDSYDEDSNKKLKAVDDFRKCERGCSF